MKEFFTTTIGAWDDGSVRLTAPGIAVVVVIIALLVVVAAVIRHRNAEKKTILTTKQLVYSAVAIALAVVCSMIKFANLPMGGSVTLFSMLFIALIGYWYGPYVGLMTAVAYGLVQFVMEPIFYTVPQMILDYPLAFGALGLGRIFCKQKTRAADWLYRCRVWTLCICSDLRCRILRCICPGRNTCHCVLFNLQCNLYRTGSDRYFDRDQSATCCKGFGSGQEKRAVCITGV